MKKRVRKIILFSIIFTPLLSMFLVQAIAPKRFIAIFQFQVLNVSYTKSMEPVLNYNDLIVIRKYDFDKLEKGDIITFWATSNDNKKIIVTHQVNEIYFDTPTNTRYIQTKGVNRPSPDLIPVSKDGVNGSNQYIGKYLFKSAFLGNFIAYLKSGLGLMALMINIIGITLIYWLLKKIDKRKKATE